MECVTCLHKPPIGLTANRELVYNLVAHSAKPLTAYDILHKLNEKRTTAPPTVYRALQWLADNHLIHRIESLNAYLACHRHDGGHEGLFIICRNCGEVAELSDSRLEKQLNALARQKGFQIQKGMVEMIGLCASCQKKEHHV